MNRKSILGIMSILILIIVVGGIIFSIYEKQNKSAEKGKETTKLEVATTKTTNEKEKQKIEQELARQKEAKLKAEAEKRKREQELERQKILLKQIEMVWVEGGEFMMGGPEGTGYNNEHPRHKVYLDGFWIGKYEVTQAQWKVVMGNNPSYIKGDNLPIEEVNWNDCQEFIRKLNQITGKEYALPTEAQWEYAARGGNKSRGYIYSGSNIIDEVAEHSANNSKSIRPVGGRQPNELGIYDMSGNAWEWCADWYGEHYYKESPVKNPRGPSSGQHRILRGGDWFSYYECRSTYRHHESPYGRFTGVSFRLCLPTAE